MKKNFIMKKLGCLILATAMTFSFVACGASQETTNNGRPDRNTTNSEENNKENNNENNKENNKENNEKSNQQVSTPEYTATILTDEYEGADADLPELDVDTSEQLKTATLNTSIDYFKYSFNMTGTDKNALVSPLSINYALALTANGAASNTLKTMEEKLYDGRTVDEFSSFITSNTHDSEELMVANSIWFRDDENRIKLNDNFLKKNKAVYDADIFKAAFDDNTITDVNAWVNCKTEGMIPDLIDEINQSDVIYLINAIAFQSEWASEYEDTAILENETFTNINNKEESVTMLTSTEDIYFEDENATGFMKFYNQENYAFMAILPNEDISLEEYINDFNADTYENLFDSSENNIVFARIPEITYDYDLSLKQPLYNMGLEDIFKIDADFSNMADTNSKALYVGDVIHKTHISIDREGTKAAAVTSVEMVDYESAEPIEFEEPKYVYLDKPFMYCIVDTEYNLPVFIGAVNSCE